MNLHDEIAGRADCASALAARDADTIAKVLSAGRTAPQSRFVTARTILAECANGGTLLNQLQSASTGTVVPPMTAELQASIAWALKFLGQEAGLDVGNPATQALIGAVVAVGVLTSAQGASLKAMGILPQTITRDQVTAAMFNPDGSAK